ncbi:DNA-directed RNA polymerase sigma-70 factor [Streptomyces sp. H27-D2]|uniref:DNA-directed RNA polymerase sigma-70 factor n=1 Tax=Streptomyces sp. H27-D2 TaxID=3046304 RepID=UPI002DB64005|nr:DNA-directed RNA polymerase sigma-70 factor [Streptomyces sp. H27-D2]MEC4015983.1 DNA-directed RNA polymerase sigma-70 factor [Streptomyces sp. H27-D2]
MTTTEAKLSRPESAHDAAHDSPRDTAAQPTNKAAVRAAGCGTDTMQLPAITASYDGSNASAPSDPRPDPTRAPDSTSARRTRQSNSADQPSIRASSGSGGGNPNDSFASGPGGNSRNNSSSATPPARSWTPRRALRPSKPKHRPATAHAATPSGPAPSPTPPPASSAAATSASAAVSAAAPATRAATLPTAAPPPPSLHPNPNSPVEAFDLLYTHAAPALTRQAYLLTGRPRLARHAVEHAFRLAWEQWPAVAVDRDPVGWVRAAAYEYALSPWHRLRPGRRISAPRGKSRSTTPAAPADSALLTALLSLPPAYRRALLLYDGVGLGLPETAAETEASTPATAGRLTYARDSLAALLPELRDAMPAEQGELLRERLNRQLVTERAAAAGTDASQPESALAESALAETPLPETPIPLAREVRNRSEARTRRRTRGALGLCGLVVAASAFTAATAPDRYLPEPERPVKAPSIPQAEPPARQGKTPKRSPAASAGPAKPSKAATGVHKRRAG